MRMLLSSLLFIGLSQTALAEPKVVTSIKPVHSLVSTIMEGVNTPTLLIDGVSSPHDFALKPSQASVLQESDIVFWIGHSLEGFLEKPLETIGSKAVSVELLETPDIKLLPFREFEEFGKNKDDHNDHGHDDHAKKDDHDEHKHEDHAKKDDHDEHGKEKADNHDHGHAHEHGAFDPHIWLNPQNAIKMARHIENQLAKVDPENAKTYRKNTESLVARLTNLDNELSENFKNSDASKYIVFHDAYQYFENHYNFSASGVVAISPETAPGAKQVSKLREEIKHDDISCLFSEPQFDAKMVTVIAEGSALKIGVLDPLGAEITAGKDHYFETLNNISGGFQQCFTAAN